MGMDIKKRIDDAVTLLQGKIENPPEFAIVLGSGLGEYADELDNPVRVAYSDIPGFPVSTVEGHEGRFVFGERMGKRVVCMQGRFHFYEGYSQQELTIPIRVMKKLGANTLVLTNAAGGVNLDFEDGVLMMIEDHINFSGDNPLMGGNLDEFGPRFPDMTRVYNREIRQKLNEVAARENIGLREGVYMMFTGPCYESPAEIRMARTMGADAVGMSTVPEAIVAAHAGMRVLGISCITNMAAGVKDVPLDHSEVMVTAQRVRGDFKRLLDLAVSEVL